MPLPIMGRFRLKNRSFVAENLNSLRPRTMNCSVLGFFLEVGLESGSVAGPDPNGCNRPVYREALSRRFPKAPVTKTWFGSSDQLDRMDDEVRNASWQPHRCDPLDIDCQLRLFGIRVAQVANR